jgi:DNA-binding ferritin-like protein
MPKKTVIKPKLTKKPKKIIKPKTLPKSVSKIDKSKTNSVELNKKDNKKINKKDNKKNNLVNSFLELLIIIKVYHWKTKSHAEHKATDELYEKLNETIDTFVEVLLGKDGSRLNMKGKKIIITDPSNKDEIRKIIYKYRILLENKMNEYISEKGNTDLYNIRDEILGSLNQFLYLITFY